MGPLEMDGGQVFQATLISVQPQTGNTSKEQIKIKTPKLLSRKKDYNEVNKRKAFSSVINWENWGKKTFPEYKKENGVTEIIPNRVLVVV